MLAGELVPLCAPYKGLHTTTYSLLMQEEFAASVRSDIHSVMRHSPIVCPSMLLHPYMAVSISCVITFAVISSIYIWY